MTNKTCVALGYFDGVHVGHKTVINAALALKQFEPAVFTFNNRESGNITTDDTKKKLISELGIGRIFSYDFERIKDYSPERFVSEVLLGELGAGSVCCGYDFRFGKGRTADADELTKICEKLGIETIVVPPVEVGGVAVSSTLIRELIVKGDTERANRLLGYELSY
ncbi:MAG: FAD synthetase family protein, partial [Oscillospiraceae bacterium]|nr:FAD synthetase family protein [Oscillospiraceae bacterium]